MQKQKLTGTVKNFVGNFGFIERNGLEKTFVTAATAAV